MAHINPLHFFITSAPPQPIEVIQNILHLWHLDIHDFEPLHTFDQASIAETLKNLSPPRGWTLPDQNTPNYKEIILSKLFIAMQKLPSHVETRKFLISYLHKKNPIPKEPISSNNTQNLTSNSKLDRSSSSTNAVAMRTLPPISPDLASGFLNNLSINPSRADNFIEWYANHRLPEQFFSCSPNYPIALNDLILGLKSPDKDLLCYALKKKSEAWINFAIRLTNTFDSASKVHDVAGNTPLHLAALKGTLQEVNLFIEKKVDPSQKNHQGLSALDLTQNPEIQNYLRPLTWSNPKVGSIFQYLKNGLIDGSIFGITSFFCISQNHPFISFAIGMISYISFTIAKHSPFPFLQVNPHLLTLPTSILATILFRFLTPHLFPQLFLGLLFTLLSYTINSCWKTKNLFFDKIFQKIEKASIEKIIVTYILLLLEVVFSLLLLSSSLPLLPLLFSIGLRAFIIEPWMHRAKKEFSLQGLGLHGFRLASNVIFSLFLAVRSEKGGYLLVSSLLLGLFSTLLEVSKKPLQKVAGKLLLSST